MYNTRKWSNEEKSTKYQKEEKTYFNAHGRRKVLLDFPMLCEKYFFHSKISCVKT